jgi:hypothetical protein
MKHSAYPTCKKIFLILLISISATKTSNAWANWDDELPATDIEIIEVFPQFNGMDGWITACSGMGCQMYLNDLSNSLIEQDIIEQNMQEFDEISGDFDEANEQEADEECGNGYTRTEMSEAFVAATLEISEAQSGFGNLLNVEGILLSAYYRDAFIGSGYRTLMGVLLTQLSNAATQRVRAEYKAAMATCG